ncbi:hypothetical protein [Streptomyces syringium]|uniref:hypothetical protein n=1 Tax=Streptomyces syringium TaxID=76729 RepID=UPI0033EA1A4B
MSNRVVVRRWLIILAVIGAIGWTCSIVSDFIEKLEGGPVRSVAAYRKQDIRTREAGSKVIGELRPGAAYTDVGSEEASTSCVDDLGFDKGGVTRDQPSYTWGLSYFSKADYLADLGKLRSAWELQGWKTHDIPPAESQNPERPIPAWPGIRTTDDHGIAISIGIDSYSGHPTLSTDGGCIRYDRDDKVTARKRVGAASGKRPAREGTLTYDDGVQVSMGPVQSITPTSEMTGGAPPAAHTYRLIVTVTNRSGAPVELNSYDLGGYGRAAQGVKLLDGYPTGGFYASSQDEVASGNSRRLEFVFSAPVKLSTLNLEYGPGSLHGSYLWLLSIP